MRTAVLAAAVCLSLVGLGSANAATAAAARIDTEIPPQDLGSALKQFAQFRDMQVLYFSASVKDVRSNGASGDLTARETLDRILSGTGLTYRYVDQNAVTLLPAGAKPLHAATPGLAMEEKEGKSGSSNRFRLAQAVRAAGENPAPVATASITSPQGPAQLQTVVVTAEKRSQNAQSVPISLTALTGADLRQQGLTNVADLSHIVPGVSVQRTGPGENTVIIRGVSSQAGVASTVGYYYGEVPTSQLLQIDLPLFDLARVEVLRGPQGTLYGSSSMGGTIKYVPNQPEFNHFSETLELGTEHIDDSYGWGHTVNAVLNLPIVDDKLAARVLLFSHYDKGYISRYLVDQNNYLLANTSIPPYRGVNSYDFYGYEIELKYQPWKNVTILPSFLSQRNESNGLFTIDLPESNLAADQLIQERDVAEPHDYNANIANLTINASFGAVKLVSSTSYYTQNITEKESSAKLQYVLLGLAPPNPVEPLWQFSTTQPRQLTQELRLSNSAGHTFEGTIGLYYNRLQSPSQDSIPFSPQWLAAYGNPATFFNTDFPAFGTIFASNNYTENTERSVFGQGTYHITDKLSATLGLRGSYYDVSGSTDEWGYANGPEQKLSERAKFHGVTPKYNITYNVTPNAMVYGTVAKGLRTGDIQAPSPAACAPDLALLGLTKGPDEYLPDSLWSYELGAKTREFNRRMTLNGSVYYIDWSNIQQTVALQCAFPFVGNLGKAAIKGGELELQLMPIDQLTLYSSLSYTDAKLKNTTPGTPGVAGDPLLLVPSWTAAVSAEYQRPINENVGGFLRLEANYEAKVYRTFVPTDFFRIAPAYHLVNLRFGAQQIDGRWEVTAYVTNLLNTFSQAGLRLSDTGGDLPNTRPVSIVQPRTFGVETVWRFKQ